MASKTSIEWTDYNWNFLRGCSRVSEGCRNCYAEGVAARFSGEGMPYEGLAKFVEHKPRWTGEISFHEDILLEPLRWKKPRRVFVNSMSDLFHEKVTDEMLDKAFAVMALTPQHTYQILTKRPERMLRYLSTHRRHDLVCLQWPRFIINSSDGEFLVPKSVLEKLPKYFPEFPLPNVWLGVSVEDQKTADERIPLLLDVPAAVRWISAEPLLGPVKLPECSFDDKCSIRAEGHSEKPLCGLDWVVVGGESGPGARVCNIAWITKIIDQCVVADVPVFVKQFGSKPVVVRSGVESRLPLIAPKGGNINEWPREFRFRQFPELSHPLPQAVPTSQCQLER